MICHTVSVLTLPLLLKYRCYTIFSHSVLIHLSCFVMICIWWTIHIMPFMQNIPDDSPHPSSELQSFVVYGKYTSSRMTQKIVTISAIARPVKELRIVTFVNWIYPDKSGPRRIAVRYFVCPSTASGARRQSLSSYVELWKAGRPSVMLVAWQRWSSAD